MVRRENVLPGTFYFHFYILYFGVLIVIDFDIHFNKKINDKIEVSFDNLMQSSSNVKKLT